MTPDAAKEILVLLAKGLDMEPNKLTKIIQTACDQALFRGKSSNCRICGAAITWQMYYDYALKKKEEYRHYYRMSGRDLEYHLRQCASQYYKRPFCVSCLELMNKVDSAPVAARKFFETIRVLAAVKSLNGKEEK